MIVSLKPSRGVCAGLESATLMALERGEDGRLSVGAIEEVVLLVVVLVEAVDVAARLFV